MIVYVCKTSLKIEDETWLWTQLNEWLKRYWITKLLPVFEDEQKAIEFCWKNWYLIMWQDDIKTNQ